MAEIKLKNTHLQTEKHQYIENIKALTINRLHSMHGSKTSSVLTFNRDN